VDEAEPEGVVITTGTAPVAVSSGACLADAVVICVRDIYVTGGIYGNARGVIQLSCGRAVAAESRRPGSRDGGNDAKGDLPDAVIGGVCDIQVSRRIFCNAPDKSHLGACSRAIVATEAADPCSGDRGDDPAARHLADTTVFRISDI
jgi:hypothetical protein